VVTHRLHQQEATHRLHQQEAIPRLHQQEAIPRLHQQEAIHRLHHQEVIHRLPLQFTPKEVRLLDILLGKVRREQRLLVTMICDVSGRWWWLMFYSHFCRLKLKWAEQPPKVMKRSQRWNNPQIWPRRDSNKGGGDLWSNTLPLDHGGALMFREKTFLEE